MNKILVTMTSKNKPMLYFFGQVYLPFINSTIKWNGLREFSDGRKIPNIYRIFIDNDDYIIIDERYNVLEINSNKTIEKELKKLYNKLKSSNPSYGTNDTSNEIEWDPTENIFIEDFIDYLKSLNREINIDKIIDEE